MMVHDLLAAIQTKWEATAALKAAWPGGLWLLAADPSVGLGNPYIVGTVIASPVDERYGGKRGYDVEIQFDAFGLNNTGTALRAGLALFDTTFTGTLLSLGTGNGTNTDVLRMSAWQPMPIEEEGEGGKRYQGLRIFSRWMCVYRWHIEE
jgi:hypothetical protein